MQDVAIALIGAVLGVLAGVVLSSWARRDRRPEPAAEVQRASRQLRGLVSQLGSAAVLVGQHDEVLAASEFARTTGLASGTRVGIPQVLDSVRQARRDSAERAVEVTVSRGVEVPPWLLDVRALPFDDDLMIVLAEDRSAVLRAEELRRDFVTNISHELKTPIGAVSLLAEALSGAADDPQAVARFARDLGVEASRLGELVSQIISLSRVQASDPLVAGQDVPIAEVVAESVDRCRTLAEHREVHVLVDVRVDEVVRGDRLQLITALSNLLQNAIKYSAPGDRVAVTSRVQPGSEPSLLELAVSDNGPGIAPEDQPRVFERFFRSDFGRARDRGGTGLGLAIVKHVAEAHGGGVSLWSRPGQGSTFTLRLPAAPPAPLQPAGRAVA